MAVVAVVGEGNDGFAAGGRVQRGEQLHEGGLARAFAANDVQRVAGADIQIQRTSAKVVPPPSWSRKELWAIDALDNRVPDVRRRARAGVPGEPVLQPAGSLALKSCLPSPVCGPPSTLGKLR